MSMPLVSIIMPLYNNASVVQRGVGSVLRQTVRQFELIVVNDGSTDGGVEIVRSMGDERIRLVSQSNKGVSAARNRGVAAANCAVIAFLDADDEWKPDFLETILKLAELFPTCSVYATHYVFKELNGAVRSPILRMLPAGAWEGVLDNYFEVASASDPPIWSSAVAMQKSALLAVGGFPEGIAVGEDLLTWARLALSQKIAYSKQQCSVFWLRGPLTGYPTRRPEIPDIVGDRLAGLAKEVAPERMKSFLKYVAMWHRMRASMFIQLREREQALNDIRKMARYDPANPRVYIYELLAWTPGIVRIFVVQIFTLLKSLRRSLRRK